MFCQDFSLDCSRSKGVGSATCPYPTCALSRELLCPHNFFFVDCPLPPQFTEMSLSLGERPIVDILFFFWHGGFPVHKKRPLVENSKRASGWVKRLFFSIPFARTTDLCVQSRFVLRTLVGFHGIRCGKTPRQLISPLFRELQVEIVGYKQAIRVSTSASMRLHD